MTWRKSILLDIWIYYRDDHREGLKFQIIYIEALNSFIPRNVSSNYHLNIILFHLN